MVYIFLYIYIYIYIQAALISFGLRAGGVPALLPLLLRRRRAGAVPADNAGRNLGYGDEHRLPSEFLGPIDSIRKSHQASGRQVVQGPSSNRHPNIPPTKFTPTPLGKGFSPPYCEKQRLYGFRALWMQKQSFQHVQQNIAKCICFTGFSSTTNAKAKEKQWFFNMFSKILQKAQVLQGV